jgi:hypothetical protein
VRFSFGYAIDARVREAILALSDAVWRPAVNGDGEPREGAWVAELTGQVALEAWPNGSRLIVRRERPHPGAQLSFTDLDGHRFQCLITDQQGNDLALLEARHRAHAIVEERAACELARDRERGARVAEAARLELKVVGVVGAAGPAGGQGGLVERSAQVW